MWKALLIGTSFSIEAVWLIPEACIEVTEENFISLLFYPKASSKKIFYFISLLFYPKACSNKICLSVWC